MSGRVSDSKSSSGYAVYIDTVLVSERLTLCEAQKHMDWLNTLDDEHLSLIRNYAKEQRQKNAARNLFASS